MDIIWEKTIFLKKDNFIIYVNMPRAESITATISSYCIIIGAMPSL